MGDSNLAKGLAATLLLAESSEIGTRLDTYGFGRQYMYMAGVIGIKDKGVEGWHRIATSGWKGAKSAFFENSFYFMDRLVFLCSFRSCFRNFEIRPSFRYSQGEKETNRQIFILSQDEKGLIQFLVTLHEYRLANNFKKTAKI